MPQSYPLPVDLASEAELDLMDIFYFYEEKLGCQQKEIYAEVIDAAIARIALNPELGQPTTKPPYRRYHVSWANDHGSHYLYYRVVEEQTLVIVRVIHDKRDSASASPFDDDETGNLTPNGREFA